MSLQEIMKFFHYAKIYNLERAAARAGVVDYEPGAFTAGTSKLGNLSRNMRSLFG